MWRFKLIIVLAFALAACAGEDTATPKPYAYHRIDLQPKSYKALAENCPYTFDMPSQARIIRPKPNEEPCWLNVEYPALQATIYLSYEQLENPQQLGKYIDEAQRMTFKHTVKASSIEEIQIQDPSKKVFGLYYRVGGNAASNSQFYLTDSSRHFIRGAMYFYTQPKADSLAPVVEYVRSDIERILESFAWK